MSENANPVAGFKFSKIALWIFYGFNILMALIFLFMFMQAGLLFVNNVLSAWADIDIIIAAFFIFTKKLKETK